MQWNNLPLDKSRPFAFLLSFHSRNSLNWLEASLLKVQNTGPCEKSISLCYRSLSLLFSHILASLGCFSAISHPYCPQTLPPFHIRYLLIHPHTWSHLPHRLSRWVALFAHLLTCISFTVHTNLFQFYMIPILFVDANAKTYNFCPGCTPPSPEYDGISSNPPGDP